MLDAFKPGTFELIHNLGDHFNPSHISPALKPTRERHTVPSAPTAAPELCTSTKKSISDPWCLLWLMTHTLLQCFYINQPLALACGWRAGEPNVTHSLGLGLMGIGGASLAADGDGGSTTSPIGAGISFILTDDWGLGVPLLERAPFDCCSTPAAWTLGQMSSSFIWKASALGGVLGGTSRRLISVGRGGGGNARLSSKMLLSLGTPFLGDSSDTMLERDNKISRISS